jgi:hypothetical protein
MDKTISERFSMVPRAHRAGQVLTRAMLMLGMSLFALLMGAADGGGCGLGQADPMNMISACRSSTLDPHGVAFACNIPKTFADADLQAAFPNAPACGVGFCVQDLDGAYAHADALLGLDATTAAARGLRCILVGPGLGDVSRFVAPPAWNLPGGCVEPSNDNADGGMCSMLGESCTSILDCCPPAPDAPEDESILCGAYNAASNYSGYCCLGPDAPCGQLAPNDLCCTGACLPPADGTDIERCGCEPDGNECSLTRECCYPSACINGFCTP